MVTTNAFEIPLERVLFIFSPKVNFLTYERILTVLIV